MAACWEFIIPRCGADVPNIEVMNFPLVVDRAVRKHLARCEDFEAFLKKVAEEIRAECDSIEQICADIHYGRANPRGGIYRAGAGSAMEYIYRAAIVGATADGRPAGEPYGSSFSPSLHALLNGPLSAVQSFSRFDMRRIVNDGPFTIEIHDTVFRNEEGEKKTAQLIKTFIDMGGHQIQINAVNRDTLMDAQKHPEKYPNLIVRVWGWSGYFNQLDVAFQEHVFRRVEFGM